MLDLHIEQENFSHILIYFGIDEFVDLYKKYSENNEIEKCNKMEKVSNGFLENNHYIC